MSSSDQVAVEIMISDYHLKVGDLWDALMGLEMQLVDQLEVNLYVDGFVNHMMPDGYLK